VNEKKGRRRRGKTAKVEEMGGGLGGHGTGGKIKGSQSSDWVGGIGPLQPNGEKRESKDGELGVY